MDKETLPPENPSLSPTPDSNVRLRSPDAPEIPARLQRELQRDQPRRRSRRGVAIAGDGRRAKPVGWRKPAIVSAVLLGVLALWAFWPAPQFDGEARDRWVQLCRDYETWYGPFVSRLDDSDAVALRELGLINAQANIGIYNFDPRYIAGLRAASYADLAASPPAVVRTEAGVAKTRAASASISRLLKAFDEWPVQVNLRSHLEVIAAHGWDRAAQRVRQVLSDAPPRGRASLTESLHLMIATEGRTSAIAAAARQLDRDLAVLERVNDPVLQHFRDTVASLDGGTLPRRAGDDEHLEDLGEALQPLAAFGERFRATLESPDWKNVDYDGFRGEGEAYALLRDPAFDAGMVFRTWLDEVQRYFAMDYDWRTAWARDTRARLDQTLTHADSLVQADRPDDADVLRKRAGSLDARIEALCGPVLTARESERLTLDRYVIEGEVANLSSTVEDLVTRASASEAVASILDERPLVAEPYRSDVVDARWRSELRVLGERLRRNGDQDAMKQDADDVRARLHALIEPGGTRSLPAVPGFGADRDAHRSPEAGALRLALTDHCRQAREAALEELLAGPLPVDPHDWDRLRSSYLDTVNAAERLNNLAHDSDRMFREVRLPDDPALRRGGQTLAERIDHAGGPLLDEPAVASAARPVLVRARSVVAAYRGGLDAAGPAAVGEPITALAAWAGRQDAGDATAPAPGFDAARDRLAVTDRLAPVTDRIDDPDRAAFWKNRLDRARRVDWAGVAEHAETSDQIAVALAAANRMAVSPDAMPPRMRFNALVAGLRSLDAAAADGSRSPARRDAALLQHARALVDGAAALRDDPDAGPWVAQLTELTAAAHDAAQQFEAIGPARVGWKLVALDDDGSVTFAYGDDRLRFARLQTPGGPLYLAETELSVGTALAAARAAQAGRDLAALLGAAAGDDARKGPRAWVYDAGAHDGLTPLAVNPGAWRVGDAAPTDASAPPAPQTPLNYVSAETAVYVAGLLGCRLPTDVEWGAAAEQWGQPLAAPNLRDRAWGGYAKRVASRIKAGERGLTWADSDRLLTEASVDSGTLEHGESDDGVVWLRPAPGPDAAAGPSDLRGNVAELVTRSPLDPAPLLDPSAGDIQSRLRTFRSAHKSAFAVVGGSALSAPNEPLDEPQAYNVFTGSRGFADVGLRLAFPAPEFSPAQRVRVLLEDAPVLGGRVAAR